MGKNDMPLFDDKVELAIVKYHFCHSLPSFVFKIQ
jgi:hypothetical protein